jgi:hypothetical protein
VPPRNPTSFIWWDFTPTLFCKDSHMLAATARVASSFASFPAFHRRPFLLVFVPMRTILPVMALTCTWLIVPFVLRMSNE